MGDVFPVNQEIGWNSLTCLTATLMGGKVRVKLVSDLGSN
jgi:hypothetical protein